MDDELVGTWWCIPSQPYVDRVVPEDEKVRARALTRSREWRYQLEVRTTAKESTLYVCVTCRRVFDRGGSSRTVCSTKCGIHHRPRRRQR